MNKSELCARLADETGLTLDEAIKVVETFFSTIRHALMKGDRVEIRGFCSWHIKEYQGYAGRNPHTGKIVDVKPKRLPFFKAGKELKAAIMSCGSIKTCQVCGKPFRAISNRARYCQNCSKKMERERKTRWEHKKRGTVDV